MRKSTFDELHSPLQREGRLWSEEQVKMIGHENEFEELEGALIAIFEKSV